MDSNGLRRRLAMTAGVALLGLPLVAVAAQPAPEIKLTVTDFTDPYLTCDSLRGEIARMDAIMGLAGVKAETVKTAQARKAHLNEILSKKSCGPPEKVNFGPDMYDNS